MAHAPLSTHLFLLAVPAALLAGALLAFFLGRRRES
jgi:uncharacterized protein YneF (UPF0154 family)